MVLLYTPLDERELEVVWRLVVESYNYVTGRREDPSSYRACMQASWRWKSSSGR